MKPCIQTYRVIIDSDMQAITEFVPATSKQDAMEWADGNGEIIQCKEFELPIDTDCLWSVLRGQEHGHFSEAEADVICRILRRYYKHC